MLSRNQPSLPCVPSKQNRLYYHVFFVYISIASVFSHRVLVNAKLDLAQTMVQKANYVDHSHRRTYETWLALGMQLTHHTLQ